MLDMIDRELGPLDHALQAMHVASPAAAR